MTSTDGVIGQSPSPGDSDKRQTHTRLPKTSLCQQMSAAIADQGGSQGTHVLPDDLGLSGRSTWSADCAESALSCHSAAAPSHQKSSASEIEDVESTSCQTPDLLGSGQSLSIGGQATRKPLRPPTMPKPPSTRPDGGDVDPPSPPDASPSSLSGSVIHANVRDSSSVELAATRYYYLGLFICY